MLMVTLRHSQQLHQMIKGHLHPENCLESELFKVVLVWLTTSYQLLIVAVLATITNMSEFACYVVHTLSLSLSLPPLSLPLHFVILSPPPQTHLHVHVHTHTDTTAQSAVRHLTGRTVYSVISRFTTPTAPGSSASSVTVASLVLIRWRITLRAFTPTRGHSNAPLRVVRRAFRSIQRWCTTLRYTCDQKRESRKIE